MCAGVKQGCLLGPFVCMDNIGLILIPSTEPCTRASFENVTLAIYLCLHRATPKLPPNLQPVFQCLAG